MININRLPCPEVLNDKGRRETENVIAFYSNNQNLATPYQKPGTKQSYITYKDEQVRKTLTKMLNGKCAYCESKILSIYNGDIEHFRPKSSYTSSDNKSTKPGYYWLCADWENLLLSCPFCNQTHTHEIVDGNTITEIVLGKLDHFPLHDEANRLKKNHGQIFYTDAPSYRQAYFQEEQVRLLLKPCTDPNIESYFIYDDDGSILVNENMSTLDQLKAATSIRTYALQRLGLIQSRKEKIIQIKAQVRRVKEAIINFDNNYDQLTERTWFECILRREMEILQKFTHANQEYAGMARYIIGKYMTFEP